MAITTRAAKGSELTHNEMDANFTDLRDGVNLMVPKTQGKGIKVDSLGTPTFGWHDLNSPVWVDEDDVNKAVFATYIGGVKQRKFTVLSLGLCNFHLPHDYAMGTDIFIHVHWSHNVTTVTGGSVTWGMEMTYAKGHDQAAFGTTKTVSVLQNASTTQYRHMIAETAASVAGGSGTQIDSASIEVDGMILVKVFLDSNDITVSGGGVPDPFVHAVDLHYQSTGITTKNRSPSFWA